MKSHNTVLFAAIRESGELSDETVGSLKIAIADFAKNYFK